jgi:hypothetical protein
MGAFFCTYSLSLSLSLSDFTQWINVVANKDNTAVATSKRPETSRNGERAKGDLK